MLLYSVLAVACAQVFYFNAVQRLSVGVALMLEYLGIILVVGWMWLRHGKKPARLTVAGSVFALVGLALVLDLLGGHKIDPIGVLWGLGAAVGLAAFYLISARTDDALASGRDGRCRHGHRLGGAARVRPHRRASAGRGGVHSATGGLDNPWWVPVLGLSIIAAAAAYAVGIIAARLLGATLASFVGLSEVLFAVLFAWLLLNELPQGDSVGRRRPHRRRRRLGPDRRTTARRGREVIDGATAAMRSVGAPVPGRCRGGKLSLASWRMKTMTLGSSSLQVPVVAVGCMRIDSLEASEAERFVKGAVDVGATFFDHADVYGGGRCEEIFADAIGMTPAVREQITLQSKVGIRPDVAFDFSKHHILTSVDGILRRLRTDYLDVLLLHRPDALVEPEEVAEAFDQLEISGQGQAFRHLQPEADADRPAAPLGPTAVGGQPTSAQHHQRDA